MSEQASGLSTWGGWASVKGVVAVCSLGAVIGDFIARTIKQNTEYELAQDVCAANHRITGVRSLQEISQEAVALFTKHCSAQRCMLWIVDGVTLRSFAASGEELSASLEHELLGAAVRSASSIYAFNHHSGALGAAASILCVPVTDPSGSVVAVAALMNDSASATFTKAHALMCRAFGFSIGVALHHLAAEERLRDMQRRSDMEIKVMKLSSADGTLADVIERIASVMCPILEALDFTILLVDSQKREFFLTASASVDENTSLSQKVRVLDARSPDGKCALDCEVVNVSNVMDSDFIQHTKISHIVQRAKHAGTHMPVLCVPAYSPSGETVAVMRALGKSQAGAVFRQTDVELLQSLADTVASIVKHRGFEQQFMAALSASDQKENQTDGSSSDDEGPPSLTLQPSVLALYTKAEPSHLEKLRVHKRDRRRQTMTPSSSEMDGHIEELKRSSQEAREDEADAARLLKHVDGVERFCDSVELDAFSLSDVQLKGVVGALLRSTGLMEEFGVSWSCLSNFVDSVAEGYLDNPYHNFRHGVTVMHVVYMLAVKGGGLQVLDRLELLALLIASLSHDIGHMGTGNNFLVATEHDLALTYNDVSPLENMHASQTFRLMKKPRHNVLRGLSREQYVQARKVIVEAILATDMSNHHDDTRRLTSFMRKPDKPRSFGSLKSIAKAVVAHLIFDKSNAKHRLMLIKSIIHAGDVSNPTFPPPISRKWSEAVAVEFNQQVEEEKKHKVPVSKFLYTSDLPSLASLNLGFIKFVVSPLWIALAGLMDERGEVFGLYLANLKRNQQTWENIIAEADTHKQHENN